MTTHVLVPVDESDMAEEAVAHVRAKFPAADVTLLHVIDVVSASYNAGIDGALPTYWDEWYDTTRESAEERLSELAADLEDEDLSVATEIVVGRPAREIVTYAEENDVDHVVMGSHGRSGVTRILLGSVAETVLRRSPAPVTIVR